MACTWMVNTMPTKPAVSSATPSERGPTSFSCSMVLRMCTLPAQRTQLHHISTSSPRTLCMDACMHLAGCVELQGHFQTPWPAAG